MTTRRRAMTVTVPKASLRWLDDLVAGGRRPRWVADARLRVGVGDAHLGFEPVGVAEEQAEDGAEVGDEPVGGALGDEAVANGVERVERRRLQAEVVDAPPAEERRLPLVLGVGIDLEQVDLAAEADVDDGLLDV